MDARAFSLILVPWVVACGPETSSNPGTTSSAGAETSGSSGGVAGTPSLDPATATGEPGTGGAESSSSTSSSGGGSTSTGAEPPPAVELPWSPTCAGLTFELGEVDPPLECALLPVPIDHDAPKETFDILVTRRPAQGEPLGTLVFFDGGPGGDGFNIYLSALGDEATARGWDLVSVHHRGTVLPLLSCPEGDLPACRAQLDAAWGADLQHFNARAAARDAALAITGLSQESSRPVHVYGSSYGTEVAQYLLETDAAGLVSRVVLDGATDAQQEVLVQESLVRASVVDLLQRCIDDPGCGPQVGLASGQALADAAVDAFDTLDCGPTDVGGWADAAYGPRLAALASFPGLRGFVPLMAALLATCTEESVAAVDFAFSQLIAPSPLEDAIDTIELGGPGFGFSVGTNAVVAATTFIDDVDAETIAAEVVVSRDAFSTSGIAQVLADIEASFGDLPRIAPPSEPPAGLAPEVLVLAARYDAQTPLGWAEPVAQRLDAPLAVFDEGRHVVAFGNGAESLLDRPTCARQILFSFLESPQPADISCAAETAQVDVALEGPLGDEALFYFGVADPWSLVSIP